MNASHSPNAPVCLPPTLKVRSYAPGVVGKSLEAVPPTMYTFPS